MSKSPIYKSWFQMKRRCTNPSDPGWPNYGGRGITVCGRWQSFANFYADMGDRPAGASLDRIDNDGNYEPGNCRWATNEEQINNRRSTRMVIADGVEMTLARACRMFGLNYKLTHSRLMRKFGEDTWHLDSASGRQAA